MMPGRWEVVKKNVVNHLSDRHKVDAFFGRNLVPAAEGVNIKVILIASPSLLEGQQPLKDSKILFVLYEVYFHRGKKKTIYILSSRWTLEWNAQLIYSEPRRMPTYSTISSVSNIPKQSSSSSIGIKMDHIINHWQVFLRLLQVASFSGLIFN